MPFFGKDPVWSPDGVVLAGSRLAELGDGSSLYGVWIVSLETGDERMIAYGCNAQWSPDGIWLAYDLHDDVQRQGYTDCFANGQVEGFNVGTGERVLFSEELTGYVTLISWSPID